MGAIIFSIVGVVILVLTCSSNPNRKAPLDETNFDSDAVAEAAARRYSRSSVVWEPRIRSVSTDGRSLRRLSDDIDPSAWDHARHYAE